MFKWFIIQFTNLLCLYNDTLCHSFAASSDTIKNKSSINPGSSSKTSIESVVKVVERTGRVGSGVISASGTPQDLHNSQLNAGSSRGSGQHHGYSDTPSSSSSTYYGNRARVSSGNGSSNVIKYEDRVSSDPRNSSTSEHYPDQIQHHGGSVSKEGIVDSLKFPSYQQQPQVLPLPPGTPQAHMTSPIAQVKIASNSTPISMTPPVQLGIQPGSGVGIAKGSSTQIVYTSYGSPGVPISGTNSSTPGPGRYVTSGPPVLAAVQGSPIMPGLSYQPYVMGQVPVLPPGQTYTQLAPQVLLAPQTTVPAGTSVASSGADLTQMSTPTKREEVIRGADSTQPAATVLSGTGPSVVMSPCTATTGVAADGRTIPMTMPPNMIIYSNPAGQHVYPPFNGQQQLMGAPKLMVGPDGRQTLVYPQIMTAPMGSIQQQPMGVPLNANELNPAARLAAGQIIYTRAPQPMYQTPGRMPAVQYIQGANGATIPITPPPSVIGTMHNGVFIPVSQPLQSVKPGSTEGAEQASGLQNRTPSAAPSATAEPFVPAARRQVVVKLKSGEQLDLSRKTEKPADKSVDKPLEEGASVAPVATEPTALPVPTISEPARDVPTSDDTNGPPTYNELMNSEANLPPSYSSLTAEHARSSTAHTYASPDESPLVTPRIESSSPVPAVVTVPTAASTSSLGTVKDAPKVVPAASPPKGKGSLQDLLAEYKKTPRPVSAAAPAPTPAVISTHSPTIGASSSSTSAGTAENQPQTAHVDDDEDEWETAAEKVELLVATAPLNATAVDSSTSSNGVGALGSSTLVKRQLRPETRIARKCYTKDEVLACRPLTMPTRPASFTCFCNGISLGNNVKVPVHGWWNRSPVAGASVMGQGNKNEGRGGNTYESGGDAWKKGQSMGPGPSGGQYGGVNKNRRNRQGQDSNAQYKSIFGEVTNTDKKTEMEVRSILNKLTPQNFPKLTAQLFEIQIDSDAMLGTLIDLVYDKAALEPNFANLYADMCKNLEEKSRYWGFLQCAFDIESGKYFWIKDLKYSEKLAGPYSSAQQAMEALESDHPPETRVVTPKPQIYKIQVDSEGTLSILFANVSQTQFYVTAQPFADIEQDHLSTEEDGSLRLFDTLEQCTKDATKANSFKRRLLTKCQSEFYLATDSTKAGSLRVEIRNSRENLMAKKATTDPEEFSYLESETDEKIIKIKRRMMGNIKFIAELYKLELLQVKVIVQCMMELLGDGASFKAVHDEYDLDMICVLLNTVGYILEVTDKVRPVFQAVINELGRISADKTHYSSRSRFNVEEVLALRQNNWMSRREQDGPATLEALKHKAAQEEKFGIQKPGMQGRGAQMQGRGGMGTGPGQGVSGRGGVIAGRTAGRGGAQQPPLQQPQPQPKLMQRPGAGQASPSGKSGKPTKGDMQQLTSSFAQVQIHSDKPSKEGKGKEKKERYENKEKDRKEGGGKFKRDDDKIETYILSNPSSAKSAFIAGARTISSRDRDSPAVEAQQSSSKFTRARDASMSPQLISDDQIDDNDELEAETQMRPEDLQKRATELIDEYLRVGDADDASLVMADLGAAFVGFSVSRILTKFVDIAKPAPQELLIDLLEHEDVVPLLSAAQIEIEDAVRNHEYLQQLTDTMMDCQKAPEWLAQVVRTLVQADGIKMSTLRDIVAADITFNVEELCALPDATQAVFERFMSAVNDDDD